MNTNGRTVIVTGGTRGLGFAIVQDLLACGYAVATCGRRQSNGLKELIANHDPRSIFWLPCNIGDEKEEAEFIRAVRQWAPKGSFFGLVNNAGISGEGILATFPNVDSAKLIEVNLLGALRLSRLALQWLLVEGRAGRIVNISSIIGSRGYTGLAAYAASKAGLDGLTRALAREVGRRQITVNSVAPGYLDTGMSSSLSESKRQQIVRRTPLGRLGTVADVVPLVRFLLSEDARFITGQTLIVDGGITC